MDRASFTDAAADLGLSQSAVSHALLSGPARRPWRPLTQALVDALG